MTQVKLFRFLNILQIAIIALLFCGARLNGQLIAPRLNPNTAAARAAALRGGSAAGPSATGTGASITLPKAAGTFTTFDAPGAINAPGGGTYVAAINAAGTIVGYTNVTVALNLVPGGFIRDHDGTFTSFAVPGAIFYNVGFYGTPGSSINASGEATGAYVDANFLFHGFIRDSGGSITTFDATGAGSIAGSFTGTIPLAINAAGEVAGFYFDDNFFGHGFVRDSGGSLTAFDAPLANTTSCYLGATYPNGINAAGEITGNFYDSTCTSRGFLRDRSGAFTVFDVPNSAGTFPLSINDGGRIAGWFFDTAGNEHGFIRDQRGSLTPFDIPELRDTGSIEVNAAGVIAGSYLDVNLVSHGFFRLPDGSIGLIDAPGAGGTSAASINAVGTITGYYTDADGVAHGFFFQPKSMPLDSDCPVQASTRDFGQ